MATYTTRKLTRSRNERMIAGVCGGIADYFDVDPTLVRIAYVALSAISAAFPGILLYVILAVVIPEK
ncbi:MAG TPA: PspC domain-containing protein [Rhodothermales bacterium]|nr:PspC domain-containing protein [Rhodothermales bacterium]